MYKSKLIKYKNRYIKLVNDYITYAYIVNKYGNKISRAIITGDTNTEAISKAKKYIDRVNHYNNITY